MAQKLQIVLPISLGAITAILTLWDIHNWNVVASMGMAWDTGAPIWPYQTSDILLQLMNYPAFVIAVPLANRFGLLAPQYHFVLFPAELLWWWVVGCGLDRRTMHSPRLGSRFILILLVIGSGLLILAASFQSAWVLLWIVKYGRQLRSTSFLVALRFMTPALWFAASSGIAALMAKSALVYRRS